MKSADSIRLTPSAAPMTAVLTVPGSKSYTNRALVLAAMTSRPVKIMNPLISDDTRAMLDCLETLGIDTTCGDGFIEVTGSINDVKDEAYELNADLSGTTMRFMLALCTLLPGEQILRGQKRLEERPVGELVDALRQLGARIVYLGQEGCLPVRVESSTLTGSYVKLGGEQSSQHLSAMLMIAPLAGGLTIEITGEQISKPYIDMTIEAMHEFGARVINDNYRVYRVDAAQYDAREYVVEGDASSAAYFFAIAALTGSTITVKNIEPGSSQADMKFLDILKAAGAKADITKQSITVTGGGLRPLTVDMRDCPDQAQTLAVLAAFADGDTTITGIKSLRVKETERVKALEQELAKMGIKTSSTSDSLTVHGGRPKAAAIDTYNDHRMAMAFAVAGAQLAGMTINDPGVVSKTFPDFWQKLAQIGIKIRTSGIKIVLIGFMGAGKSSVAPRLASKLNLQAIEMDDLIVERTGKSIADIFAGGGEAAFRKTEAAVGRELRDLDGVVISTGGGVVTNEGLMDSLAYDALVVHLDAPFKTAITRAGSSAKRPLLDDKNKARALYESRRPLYSKYGAIRVDTDHKTVGRVVQDIINKIDQLP